MYMYMYNCTTNDTCRNPTCMVLCVLCNTTFLHTCDLPNRPKHPTKVHIWAGISRRGKTGICIFEGIMRKELYVEILEQTLLPFTRSIFPDGFNFMQDNDPKHVSNYAKEWMERNCVTWWKPPPPPPPPESPDLRKFMA